MSSYNKDDSSHRKDNDSPTTDELSLTIDDNILSSLNPEEKLSSTNDNSQLDTNVNSSQDILKFLDSIRHSKNYYSDVVNEMNKRSKQYANTKQWSTDKLLFQDAISKHQVIMERLKELDMSKFTIKKNWNKYFQRTNKMIMLKRYSGSDNSSLQSKDKFPSDGNSSLYNKDKFSSRENSSLQGKDKFDIVSLIDKKNAEKVNLKVFQFTYLYDDSIDNISDFTYERIAIRVASMIAELKLCIHTITYHFKSDWTIITSQNILTEVIALIYKKLRQLLIIYSICPSLHIGWDTPLVVEHYSLQELDEENDDDSSSSSSSSFSANTIDGLPTNKTLTPSTSSAFKTISSNGRRKKHLLKDPINVNHTVTVLQAKLLLQEVIKKYIQYMIIVESKLFRNKRIRNFIMNFIEDDISIELDNIKEKFKLEYIEAKPEVKTIFKDKVNSIVITRLAIELDNIHRIFSLVHDIVKIIDRGLIRDLILHGASFVILFLIYFFIPYMNSKSFQDMLSESYYSNVISIIWFVQLYLTYSSAKWLSNMFALLIQLVKICKRITLISLKDKIKKYGILMMKYSFKGVKFLIDGIFGGYQQFLDDKLNKLYKSNIIRRHHMDILSIYGNNIANGLQFVSILSLLFLFHITFGLNWNMNMIWSISLPYYIDGFIILVCLIYYLKL